MLPWKSNHITQLARAKSKFKLYSSYPLFNPLAL